MNTLMNTRTKMHRWTQQLSRYVSDVKKRSDEVNKLGVKSFILSNKGK
jgi:hypothetical protein